MNSQQDKLLSKAIIVIGATLLAVLLISTDACNSMVQSIKSLGKKK